MVTSLPQAVTTSIEPEEMSVIQPFSYIGLAMVIPVSVFPKCVRGAIYACTGLRSDSTVKAQFTRSILSLVAFKQLKPGEENNNLWSHLRRALEASLLGLTNYQCEHIPASPAIPCVLKLDYRVSAPVKIMINCPDLKQLLDKIVCTNTALSPRKDCPDSLCKCEIPWRILSVLLQYKKLICLKNGQVRAKPWTKRQSSLHI